MMLMRVLDSTSIPMQYRKPLIDLAIIEDPPYGLPQRIRAYGMMAGDGKILYIFNATAPISSCVPPLSNSLRKSLGNTGHREEAKARGFSMSKDH